MPSVLCVCCMCMHKYGFGIALEKFFFFCYCYWHWIAVRHMAVFLSENSICRFFTLIYRACLLLACREEEAKIICRFFVLYSRALPLTGWETTEKMFILCSVNRVQRERKVAGSGRQTDREKGKRANIYREFQTTAITTTSKNMGRKESLFAPAAMSK